MTADEPRGADLIAAINEDFDFPACTVRELIASLEQCNPDALVLCFEGDGSVKSTDNFWMQAQQAEAIAVGIEHYVQTFRTAPPEVRRRYILIRGDADALRTATVVVI